MLYVPEGNLTHLCHGRRRSML